MSEINLLPVDLSPNRGVVKFGLSLKKVNIALMSIFLTVLVLSLAVIVFLRTQIDGSINKQKQITQNIQNLEATEQKLFLTKDRLSKIKAILGESGKLSTYEEMDSILSSLSGNVIPYNVEIDSNRNQFSVLSKDSLTMAQFLNSLVTNGIYKKLKLSGFVFSPSRGYLITLESS